MSNRLFLLIVTFIGLLTLAAYLLGTYQDCTADGGRLVWGKPRGFRCEREPRASRPVVVGVLGPMVEEPPTWKRAGLS